MSPTANTLRRLGHSGLRAALAPEVSGRGVLAAGPGQLSDESTPPYQGPCAPAKFSPEVHDRLPYVLWPAVSACLPRGARAEASKDIEGGGVGGVRPRSRVASRVHHSEGPTVRYRELAPIPGDRAFRGADHDSVSLCA